MPDSKQIKLNSSTHNTNIMLFEYMPLDPDKPNCHYDRFINYHGDYGSVDIRILYILI